MVWASLFGGFDATTPKDGNKEEETPKNNSDEAFECDYETDCTPLYRSLENAIDVTEFDPIIKFLDTGYWRAVSSPTPSSPRCRSRRG
jgi:hypothetical protein